MKQLLLVSLAFVSVGTYAQLVQAQVYDRGYDGRSKTLIYERRDDLGREIEDAQQTAEEAKEAAEETLDLVKDKMPNKSEQSIAKAVEAAKANGKPTSDVTDGSDTLTKPEKSITTPYDGRSTY